MRCPACGVYHPPLYEECVSCGAKLGTADGGASPQAQADLAPDAPAQTTGEPAPPAQRPTRRSKALPHPHRGGLPAAVGMAVAIFILLVSAGATIFILTKPPDYERLYQQGQRELANGQYAFAVKTLEQSAALKPGEAKIFLALARAYVGVDQIDRAWNCISQAQQLGSGVASEPALASELANYYRQRQQWDRAADLLRPLAQADLPGKRAELADLDGLWGDDALRAGNLDQALKCWEEVKTIGEGSRVSEADSRLATIYQRIAGNLLGRNEDARALEYLVKLNALAPSAATYEKIGEIYERQGQLELAIDQLRKAERAGSVNPALDRKLAQLMARRGKELLDQGDTQAGFGYLQEARSLDPANVVPSVALRNVSVLAGAADENPQLTGEVWNPGPNPVNQLTLKTQLYDLAAGKTIWEREDRIVDEFVPPLAVNDIRPFSVTAPVAVRRNGTVEFRVYLNGGLYKTYPVGKREPKGGAAGAVQPAAPGSPAATTEEKAPPVVPQPQAPLPAPEFAPPPLPAKPAPAQPPSSEDKTLKDLDL